MRRNKEWWARLDADERARLWHLERCQNYGYPSWNLPEDARECPMCSTPTNWGGLCHNCSSELASLLKKANKEA